MPTFATSLGSSAPPPVVYQRPLAEGDPGTADTVREMCRLIDEGASDPEINRLAIAIVKAAGVRPLDFEGERRAVYAWIRRNLRYVRDVDGKETLRGARETLTVGAGDCDCLTIVTLALLRTLGQRGRIVTIATHPEAPDLFSHVFAEVRDERGRWIPLDTARKNPAYGRGPAGAFRVWAWDPLDGSREDVTQTYPFDRRGGGSGRGLFAGLGYLGAPVSWAQQSRALGLRGPSARRRMRARLRGLGDGSSWSSTVLQALPTIETGTANIIAASRANPINLEPTTSLTQQPGGLTAAQASLYGASGLGSLNMGTLLLLGGGILVVMLLARKS